MGAPDPRDDVGRAAIHPAASDPIAGRSHWAYRPIDVEPPRHVEPGDWPTSTIDRYVLSQLQAQRLQPAPDADWRTLVRRTYFQLIGLPPTGEQVAAFLEDDRPDRLAHLVDKLLASPQFGERWGRHWLDLARYADSNGLDENFLFREAWRYRNWVIDAVNADMPFDRFLLEQIAGDLLPFESVEERDQQRIAAGFLVVGPKVLLGVDPKQQRMQVADEQIDTIGRAVLAQTLGCARCHDHKFDPVPTADYYALAGVLSSTNVMESRYMLGEQRVMEQLIGLGPEGEDRDNAYEEKWREGAQLNGRKNQAQSALDLLKKGDLAAVEAIATSHAGAVAEAAVDATRPMELRIEAQQALAAEIDAALAALPEIPPRAMVPADVETPADEAIRIGGRFDQLGEKIPRGFLRVLGDAELEIAEGHSGRLELARWLTDVEHGAGHLAARVLANRVWHHLIGRGIVRTVDNFGRTGDQPSHPELLDYLASELIRSGWSLKHLVRTVVLSRTFALSSRHDESCYAIDPDNRFLWRAHRRRLDPESLRDAMLSVAGTLDLKPMDSTVWYLGDQATKVGDNTNRRRTDFPCRSVYLPVIRNDLPELFQVFNFADPQATTGARPQTVVPTQGLFLLNDPSVVGAAQSLARRLLAEGAPGDDSKRVDMLFEWLLGTAPTSEERRELLTFVDRLTNRFSGEGVEDPSLRAWSIACHAMFSTSRFQFLE
jgi:hypothetical protein